MLGVEKKPNHCKNICCQFTIGSGFVRDFSPKAPRVAFMVPSPTGDDCINRRVLSGKGGASFEKHFIAPLGYSWEDYMVTSVLRCRPKGDGSKGCRHGQYPTGSVRKGAEQSCRFYDRGGPLEKFDPDAYVLTFELQTIYQEPAFTRLLARDIEKAFTLAERGYRPIVLMGNPTAAMVCPFIEGAGGVKAWRGHWGEMQEGWPWLSGQTKVKGTANRFVLAQIKKETTPTND